MRPNFSYFKFTNDSIYIPRSLLRWKSIRWSWRMYSKKYFSGLCSWICLALFCHVSFFESQLDNTRSTPTSTSCLTISFILKACISTGWRWILVILLSSKNESVQSPVFIVISTSIFFQFSFLMQSWWVPPSVQNIEHALHLFLTHFFCYLSSFWIAHWHYYSC
jgi:hypothetical protein